MKLIRNGPKAPSNKELLLAILEAQMVSQEQLDALAARVEAATTEIKTEVETLKTEQAAGNTLDLSKLEGAVGGLESIEPAAAVASTSTDGSSTAQSDAPATTVDPAASL